MLKAKLALGVFATLLLLFVSGCQPDEVTTTVSTTKTETKSTTITATLPASTVTETSTVMTTVTDTVTITPSTTTSTSSSSTTTTSSSGFEPVTSPDGKLQITEAEYLQLTVTDNLITGKVKNLSDEILSARITGEFLNNADVAQQTHKITITDLEPGEERYFEIKADLSLNPFAGFTVEVEVLQ